MARECPRLVCAVSILMVLIVPRAVRAGVQQPTDPEGERSGWEQLNLSRITIEGTVVHYEKALEPNLPVFEREFAKLLAQKSRTSNVVGKEKEIIADINRILGAADADGERQSEDFARLSGSLSKLRLILRLVRIPTVKDFLRAGGQLPDFSYDREKDAALYRPQIHWGTDVEPPEDFEFCILIAADKDFSEQVSAVLPALRHLLGDGVVNVAIHEITEMTLVRRARPTDPYWRWFSDGCADAITHRLVEKYVGSEAAEEFAAWRSLEEQRPLENEINLAYWMMGNFFVYVSETPVERENEILHARYTYSMFEAERLISEHGLSCVREILDKVAAQESRKGSDLLAVIEEVTGEDMAARLAHYQTFATREEGIAKYGRAYQAALPGRDWETMFVNLLRIMELRGDVFTVNYLQSFRNAALILFKMGHEAAGDAALRQAIRLYSSGPVEQGRAAALETFVIYALECDNPGKAEREADELLRTHQQNVPSLTVKMLVALRRGDLVGARELAGRIQSRADEESNPYKLASRVLAIDPNQPNTYNRAP